MEFHEKLQELRKRRGITQEELAENLYVSRTAISKWESGKGYPSIDSLKAIANYFSVTIDDLLSGEKLLFIAEKENQANVQNVCDMLFGMIDICAFLLILLPLYPNTIGGCVYSVNLFAYTQSTALNRTIYWIMFVLLVLVGVIKIAQTKFRPEIKRKYMTEISMVLSIFLVLFLAIAREAYAVTVAFLLLIIKGVLLLKSAKHAVD